MMEKKTNHWVKILKFFDNYLQSQNAQAPFFNCSNNIYLYFYLNFIFYELANPFLTSLD